MCSFIHLAAQRDLTTQPVDDTSHKGKAKSAGAFARIAAAPNDFLPFRADADAVVSHGKAHYAVLRLHAQQNAALRAGAHSARNFAAG